MEREELQLMLEAGMSVAAIGRETGRHPSTVSYWVAKHGLSLSESARHAPRGPLSEDLLRTLVAERLSTREIAVRVDRSQATVRHWLRRYRLQTDPFRRSTEPVDSGTGERQLLCATHGLTEYRPDSRGTMRCLRCRSAHVAARRRRVKEQLVAEAGGCCALCGYDRCLRALQFHHVDPATKEFAIGPRGVTFSIARARVEAAKCVLLCGNCHAEVEAGVQRLP